MTNLSTKINAAIYCYFRLMEPYEGEEILFNSFAKSLAKALDGFDLYCPQTKQ